MREILRRRRVEEVIGGGRSLIYDAMNEGWFPRPVKLSGSPAPNAPVGWFADEIALLQAARAAERDGRLTAFIAERRAERGEVEPWLQGFADRHNHYKPRRRKAE